jgi:hypothetical protein
VSGRPPVAEPVVERPEPVRLRDGVRFCVVVYLIARVTISLTGALAVSTHPPDASALGGGATPVRFIVPATTGAHNAADGMDRWDAAWFRWIAAEGYGPDVDNRAAFMPGYPILIRAAGPLVGGDEHAALIVSNGCYLLALIVLFALTAKELGRGQARWVVAFFAAMPASFFFLAPYSEAPFLLATLLAFWWSRARQPILAGLAAGAAALIRILGITLIPALALLWFRRREGSWTASLIVTLSPVIALLGYGTWWGVVYGDALAPVRAQDYWRRTISVPMLPFVRGVGLAISAVAQRTSPWLVVDAAITLAVLVTATWMLRRIPVPYVAYTWTALFVPLTTAPAFRPLDSVPRLTSVLFPLAWTWVVTLRRREPLAVTIGVMAVSQLALAAVFMNWGWIF